MSESVIRQVQIQLQRRRRELKEELSQIEAALDALAPREAPRRRKRKSPKPRQQQVLRTVRAKPGMSAAEISQQLGIKPGTAYGALNRLQEQHQIAKVGKAWFPASEEAAPTFP